MWNFKKRLKDINIFHDFKDLDKNIKEKVDYTISAISGLEGFDTFKVLRKTKRIAVANKDLYLRVEVNSKGDKKIQSRIYSCWLWTFFYLVSN